MNSKPGPLGPDSLLSVGSIQVLIMDVLSKKREPVLLLLRITAIVLPVLSMAMPAVAALGGGYLHTLRHLLR